MYNVVGKVDSSFADPAYGLLDLSSSAFLQAELSNTFLKSVHQLPLITGAEHRGHGEECH